MPDSFLLPLKNDIEKIDGIFYGEEEKKDSWISLKTFFLRQNMDKYGVNARKLYEILAGVLQLTERLEDCKICPGLLDLNDFYLDPAISPAHIYLLNASRFQYGQKEQDYEWYPEEERLFGDLLYFDHESQRMAYERLFYKILIACSKGNVKLPPAPNEADYSGEFYETLDDSLKKHFLNREVWTSSQWEEFLSERFSSGSHKHDSSGDLLKEEISSYEEVERSGESYDLYVLLRTDADSALVFSRLLYEEMEENIARRKSVKYSYQGFVHGDRNVMVSPFAVRGPEFRAQLSHKIKPYSAGEALLIAADYMEECLKVVREDASYGMHIITEQRLSNDRMFLLALSRLLDLKEKGVAFSLKCSPDAAGEAMEKLKYVTS